MSLNNQPTPVEIINEINLKAPLASPALTGTPMVNGKNIALTSVNNNFSTSQTITGNLTVKGDITQNGSSYETHAEQIYTKDDYIILRDEATGGLATGAYTGFEAVKYDGTNNGRLVFDNTGTARVGDSGSETPLTTRAESSEFTNGHLVKWNSTTIGLEDSGKTIGDFATHTLNSGVSVIGTSKTTESIGTNQLIFPNGAVFSGSAVAAGLVTRGICGVTTPTATGACEKENLYINYDNTNTYNAGRQLVLQAGSVGNHYGSNLYQYAAARGDAVKNWVESKYYLKSNPSNYISKITSSMVTTALGYTPYNSTNPNGYTTNTGTITGIKMNGSSKGTSGVVDLGTVITADGGTINKSKTVKMDASANSNGANLKWGTVNSKNPYIGYASDQTDGTFVVGSLLGTNYASGLTIGGDSGNLLWKGAKVATTSDIPNISGKLDKSAFSLSGTTLTITI